MYNDDLEYLDFIRRTNSIITKEDLGNLNILPSSVLNQNQNWDEITKNFITNNVTVIDNFLQPEFANRLREFYLYYNYRHDIYKDYASINFYRENNKSWFPILSNIVDETKQLINFLHDYSFRRAWAFIYENTSDGVCIHADSASININLWVTPEESIISEPECNGLNIWKIFPPDDWDYETYNRNPIISKKYIDENNAEKISIDYKFNRAMIFNSKFFHQTQPVRTKSGYENRRINYTFLFD